VFLGESGGKREDLSEVSRAVKRLSIYYESRDTLHTFVGFDDLSTVDKLAIPFRSLNKKDVQLNFI